MIHGLLDQVIRNSASNIVTSLWNLYRTKGHLVKDLQEWPHRLEGHHETLYKCIYKQITTESDIKSRGERPVV
ncbi:hypothetical protein BGZ76_007376, partial [Entomortierella beljakovae]